MTPQTSRLISNSIALTFKILYLQSLEWKKVVLEYIAYYINHYNFFAPST